MPKITFIVRCKNCGSKLTTRPSNKRFDPYEDIWGPDCDLFVCKDMCSESTRIDFCFCYRTEDVTGTIIYLKKDTCGRKFAIKLRELGLSDNKFEFIDSQGDNENDFDILLFTTNNKERNAYIKSIKSMPGVLRVSPPNSLKSLR